MTNHNDALVGSYDSLLVFLSVVFAIVRTPGRRYPLSLNLGIISANTSAPSDLQHLLQQADARMYEQKAEKEGRTRSRQFSRVTIRRGCAGIRDPAGPVRTCRG